MINEDLLETYKATLKHFEKGQLIFSELESANFYYQIKKGHVKMFNLNTDGKEFVQGFFEDKQSFGEPPLIGDFAYPASAECVSNASIYVLKKEQFIKLLKEHQEVHLQITAMLCNRIHYKAKTMRESSIFPPEHRILTLLNHLKSNTKSTESFEIDFTRQQISDLTGLRIETVIRTIKKLEKAGKLSIVNRKVYI